MAQEILDSIKAYVADRLKNPYIASVIATWLFLNRVLAFGLFNFESTLTLEQRVEWVNQHFNYYKIWWVSGLFLVTLYSIIGGWIAMFVYNKINLLGKISFHWINKGTIRVLQELKPADWIKYTDYENQIKKTVEAEAKIDKAKAEIRRIETDIKDANDRFNNYELRMNKLRILYARYFTEKNSVDITKKLNSFIVENKLDTSITNEIEGDPDHGTGKEFEIIYEYKREVRIVRGKEGETINIGGK